MKILVLSSKPPWPPHDGGAVATLRCIESLAASSANVSLLSMITEKHCPGDGNPDIGVSGIVEEYRTVPVDTALRPLKMLGNFLFSGEPYDLVRFISPLYGQELHAMLSGTRYDIVQCEGLLFTNYVQEIRKATTAPVILRAHNLEHKIREMMGEGFFNPFRKIYLRNLSQRLRKTETEACSRFDAVVPISEPDYLWYRNVCAEKPVFLFETGMPEAEYVPEQESGNIRVGFIGALNWQPNIMGLRWFLKHVWPCVSARVPLATLYIAGRGARQGDRRWLRGTRVTFEGEVNDSRAFMTSMNVLIAPLFAGSGLRIKILEAMSLGRTMVATPVAVSGLPVEDGRELLIASDSSSFCSKLTRVLTDPVLRASAGQAATKLVRERYDNHLHSAELIGFYRNLSHAT
jgi:glycosyltransferase involved in cell wall biosynthesis